jgi:hypothetical protein
MRGVILPLSDTPSWSGAQLKRGTETTVPLLYLLKRLYPIPGNFISYLEGSLSNAGGVIRTSFNLVRQNDRRIKDSFCTRLSCVSKLTF